MDATKSATSQPATSGEASFSSPPSLPVPISRQEPQNPVREFPILEAPKGWSNDSSRLHTVTKMFPKEKYGISARVSVLPLLVSDEEYKGNYLVEYPEGQGTYCFWHEDQAKDQARD
ncbi:hypothetical protein MMC22_008441 [Lobaria immixta]|nr:hypothetical protein [Lobaria immixta]